MRFNKNSKPTLPFLKASVGVVVILTLYVLLQIVRKSGQPKISAIQDSARNFAGEIPPNPAFNRSGNESDKIREPIGWLTITSPDPYLTKLNRSTALNLLIFPENQQLDILKLNSTRNVSSRSANLEVALGTRCAEIMTFVYKSCSALTLDIC